MSIIIEFVSPEEEAAFKAKAAQEGLSVGDWLRKIGREQTALSYSEASSARPLPRTLPELLLNSPFAGADLNLERVKDYPRSIGLE